MLCDRHWIFCSTASIHLKAQICSTVLTVEAYIELWTILLFITLITKYPQSSNDFPSANTIATGKWTEWWLVNRFFIGIATKFVQGVSAYEVRTIDRWAFLRVRSRRLAWLWPGIYYFTQLRCQLEYFWYLWFVIIVISAQWESLVNILTIEE